MLFFTGATEFIKELLHKVSYPTQAKAKTKGVIISETNTGFSYTHYFNK